MAAKSATQVLPMSEQEERPEPLEWLQDAEQELDDALYMYEDGRLESAAFHFHQAVEKGLKALAIDRDGDYPRSHDLMELAGPEVRDRFMPVLRDLTPVYTGVRYPDAETETLELDDLVDEVEELVAWIRTRLDR